MNSVKIVFLSVTVATYATSINVYTFHRCLFTGGRGYIRYLPPWSRYLPPSQVLMGGGGAVSQETYLPTPWGRLYSKVPTSPNQGTYPLPGIGQQMKYLIRRGRYASCVHAGGLSCLKFKKTSIYYWQHNTCKKYFSYLMILPQMNQTYLRENYKWYDCAH